MRWFATLLILTAMLSLVPAALTRGADEVKLETTVEKVPHTAFSFKLIKIPAGKIEITKADGATETVEIKSVWMGETELTWEAYDPWWTQADLTDKQKADGVDAANRPSKPYGAPDRGFGHDGFAVVSIAPQAAERYCEWLSKKTGKKYRLATEAEWEYACRAGGAPVKPKKSELEEMAWFDGNSETETGDMAPHAVKQKKPNAWGFYDMLGNVGEWVKTPTGELVLAGGWYDEKATKVHSGARAKYNPNWQMRDPQDPKSKWWLSDGPHAGFRVVRED